MARIAAVMQEHIKYIIYSIHIEFWLLTLIILHWITLRIRGPLCVNSSVSVVMKILKKSWNLKKCFPVLDMFWWNIPELIYICNTTVAVKVALLIMEKSWIFLGGEFNRQIFHLIPHQRCQLPILWHVSLENIIFIAQYWDVRSRRYGYFSISAISFSS